MLPEVIKGHIFPILTFFNKPADNSGTRKAALAQNSFNAISVMCPKISPEIKV